MALGCRLSASARGADSTMVFKRAVIVGVGLLGGSVGLALRARGMAEHIVGWGRRAESLQEALQLGAADSIETDLQTACRDADLVVVCTPVQCVVPHVLSCLEVVAANGLITDVGSTKLSICDGLTGPGDANFCGSHPLAGSEKSGVRFASPELFCGKLAVVTPSSQTCSELAHRTEKFWQALGSRTLRMSPLEHDCGVAQTSHLPHIVAAALAAGTPDALLPLAASGWCDTTRVAAGGVELWRQILQQNRTPVLDVLQQFSASLEIWIEALRRDDAEQIEQLLLAGKQQRDSVGN